MRVKKWFQEKKNAKATTVFLFLWKVFLSPITFILFWEQGSHLPCVEPLVLDPFTELFVLPFNLTHLSTPQASAKVLDCSNPLSVALVGSPSLMLEPHHLNYYTTFFRTVCL